MIRDARMAALVAPEQEPITPFLRRVRGLFEDHGVSSIVVVGGSGDYFAAADTVVQMDKYAAVDRTGKRDSKRRRGKKNESRGGTHRLGPARRWG